VIKDVGIFVKRKDGAAASKACELVRWLNDRGVKVYLEPESECRARQSKLCVRGSLFKHSELMIVLGGDGTFIAAVRGLGSRRVPVLGVNMGGLGYLTEITLDEMYGTIEAALKGKVEIEHRMNLQVIYRNASTGSTRTRHVLNDAVINRSAIARMIEMNVFMDGSKTALIRADGIILSTPTGSTAYAMSAGGPIVHPTLPSIVIAPICPHTLNLRPVIVPAEAEIKVQLMSKEDDVYLTLDGQEGWEMGVGDSIRARRGRYDVLIVKSPSKSTFDIMRSKLHWARY